MERVYDFFFDGTPNMGGTITILTSVALLWNDVLRHTIQTDVIFTASELMPLFLIIYLLVALGRAIIKWATTVFIRVNEDK